jgi:hypothetical protein
MTRSGRSLVWAVGLAGLHQVSVLPAAAEPDGAQLLALVDSAAVVETMARACEHSRPELATAFVIAQRAWWLRNGRVEEKLLTLQSEIGKPRATAFLRYYETLGEALRGELDGLRDNGNAAYAAHCDEVLNKLIHGGMDYQRPPKASRPG